MKSTNPLFFLLAVILCAVPGIAAETETVWNGLLVEDATARSGPGDAFYETSQLWNGDRVEVYETTQDGWCAIRPPIGSFSWVSALYVEPSANGVGTVTAEGLAARVGSELTDQCQIVAVRLKKGEKVMILDRKETPANSASPLWYKIAPPSGEFRWVRQASIIPALDRPVPAHRSRPSATLRQVAYGSDDARDGSNGNILPAAPDAHALPATPVPVQPKPVRPEPTITSPEEAFRTAFDDLRRESRNVLTRPTEDWIFETLLKRCDELHQIAPGDHDREQVRHLSEALRRTQSIRREIAGQRTRKGFATPPSPSNDAALPNITTTNRSTGTLPSANACLVSLNTPEPVRVIPSQYSTDRTTAPVVATATPATASSFPAPTSLGAPEDTSPVKATFDQVGRLGAFVIEAEPGRPRSPLPAGHPPYGLADEKGELICYLSPAEGVEMSGLINRWVAVNGDPGVYGKDARHITVRSIAPVQR